MSGKIVVLRPELETVPQLLARLAERHGTAEAVVAVIFQDGEITLVAKAPPELIALAGAHMLRAAAAE